MKIFLRTKDDKKIAAGLFEVEKPPAGGGILMIHMMPAVKESWNELAQKFQKLGYESLAVDLRGHGESDGGSEGYLKFSDVEHQAGILDVEAGVEFLKSRAARPEKIFLIGASIGANLSLQFLAGHPEIKKAILLSPGLNYRGVLTEPAARAVKTDQQILLVSSEDDGGNAAMGRKLFSAFGAGVKKELIVYKNAGHGTTMLKSGERPNLTGKIVQFVQY